MFKIKISVWLGVLLLVTGCASDRYLGNADGSGGQPETKLTLGKRYLMGRGAPQNDEKAFDYFLAAAKEGNVFAQNEVAYLYAAGKGTEQSYPSAFYYYQKAAAQGLSSAQFNLSVMFEKGLGVAPNAQKSRYWLEKSAAKGFEPAKRALAGAGS